MNFYNPYLYNMQPVINTPKIGLFSRIFKGSAINFSSILSKTQKTLSFVNQVIPVVKQVKPVVKNAKTMFRVMNEFKKVDIKNTNFTNNNISKKEEKKDINNQTISNNKSNNIGPTFFI